MVRIDTTFINQHFAEDINDDSQKHVQIYIYLSCPLSDAYLYRDLDRRNVRFILSVCFIRQ